MKLALLTAFLLFATVARADVLELTWQDNSNNEDGFIIERGDTTWVFSAIAPSVWTEIARVGANVTIFRDGASSVEAVLWYRVIAFRNGGARSPSSNFAVWDPATLVPAPTPSLSPSPTPSPTPSPSPTPTIQAIEGPSGLVVRRKP